MATVLNIAVILALGLLALAAFGLVAALFRVTRKPPGEPEVSSRPAGS